jgi:putative Ca2+/H+ antiporter (TMEM165/GDT1 family)
MITEIITVFTIIFIAELGDKSQILAMSFATRYKMKQVLMGVFIGIVLNHILAVLLGMFLGTLLIGYQVSLLVGTIFAVFAVLTLLDRAEEEPGTIKRFGPVITISLAFFLGELGDKTQFATMAFASESTTPFLVLVGSVSAMMFVSLIGIVIGRTLGEKVPDYFVRVGSSLLFIIYGLLKLNNGMSDIPVGSIWIVSTFAFIGIVYVIFLYKSYMVYQRQDLTTFQKIAKHLYEYHRNMSKALEYICLGEEVCGPCKKKDCIIGHTKFLIEESKKGRQVDVSNISDKVFKDIEKDRILMAIDITLDEIKDHWNDPDFIVLHHIRHNLDMLLFGHEIVVDSYDEYNNIIETYRKTIRIN